MPAPKSPLVSRETRICLHLWRKALLENGSDQPLVQLKARNYSAAIALRSSMYRAIRPYRHGIEADEVLSKASEVMVLTLEKGPTPSDPATLTIRPRISLQELESQFEALGIDESDLLLPHERKVTEELEALITPSKPRSTPFYTREG